jgi:hypothetical protein
MNAVTPFGNPTLPDAVPRPFEVPTRGVPAPPASKNTLAVRGTADDRA